MESSATASPSHSSIDSKPARTGIDLMRHRRTQTGRAAIVAGVVMIILGITSVAALVAGVVALGCAAAWFWFCVKTEYFHERAFWWSIGKAALIFFLIDLVHSAGSM